MKTYPKLRNTLIASLAILVLLAAGCQPATPTQPVPPTKVAPSATDTKPALPADTKPAPATLPPTTASQPYTFPDFIYTVRDYGGGGYEEFQRASMKELGVEYVQGLVDFTWGNIERGDDVWKWIATADTLKYAVDVGSGGNCGVLGSAQCDEIDAIVLLLKNYHDREDFLPQSSRRSLRNLENSADSAISAVKSLVAAGSRAMPATDYRPWGVSVGEDAADYPIIAYQSELGSLNVARPVAALGLPGGSGNCGPENPFSTWYCETINRYNPWTPARHGDFVSLALSSSGLATIAYYGFITSSDGNLMVAYQRFQVFLPVILKNQ